MLSRIFVGKMKPICISDSLLAVENGTDTIIRHIYIIEVEWNSGMHLIPVSVSFIPTKMQPI